MSRHREISQRNYEIKMNHKERSRRAYEKGESRAREIYPRAQVSCLHAHWVWIRSIVFAYWVDLFRGELQNDASTAHHKYMMILCCRNRKYICVSGRSSNVKFGMRPGKRWITLSRINTSDFVQLMCAAKLIALNHLFSSREISVAISSNDSNESNCSRMRTVKFPTVHKRNEEFGWVNPTSISSLSQP